MGRKEDLLKKELETYKKHKDELVKESEGKYVLIKGSEIINIFKSEEDAIKMGISKFGNDPFLVKKIERIEHIHNFTSNLIGCDSKCHH